MKTTIVAGPEWDRLMGPWICERTGGTWLPGIGTTIGLISDNAILAGVLYDQFNGASICMHVASDGSRHWLNRKFLYYAFYYPFVELQVGRVTGLVPADNPEAIRFDEHIGFTREARLERAWRTGADMLVYRMFREDCRWLDLGSKLRPALEKAA